MSTREPGPFEQCCALRWLDGARPAKQDEGRDADGWPHNTVKEELPPLKAGEQSILMKGAIVDYFLEKGLIK